MMPNISSYSAWAESYANMTLLPVVWTMTEDQICNLQNGTIHSILCLV